MTETVKNLLFFGLVAIQPIVFIAPDSYATALFLWAIFCLLGIFVLDTHY